MDTEGPAGLLAGGRYTSRQLRHTARVMWSDPTMQGPGNRTWCRSETLVQRDRCVCRHLVLVLLGCGHRPAPVCAGLGSPNELEGGALMAIGGVPSAVKSAPAHPPKSLTAIEDRAGLQLRTALACICGCTYSALRHPLAPCAGPLASQVCKLQVPRQARSHSEPQTSLHVCAPSLQIAQAVQPHEAPSAGAGRCSGM
jgi:hypothetical protein